LKLGKHRLLTLEKSARHAGLPAIGARGSSHAASARLEDGQGQDQAHSEREHGFPAQDTAERPYVLAQIAQASILQLQHAFQPTKLSDTTTAHIFECRNSARNSHE
jgi:hypothetical protein